MRRNRVLAVVTAAALVVSQLTGIGITVPEQEPTVKAATGYASVAEDNEVFDNYNASEITLNMGAGWNLGNQLEASYNGTPSETAWSNPVITQKTLDMVKEAGFKTVRIPISYLSKIGAAPDYTIDSAWLNRIKEVVDYAMNAGLYVIINMHGDGYNSVTGGWLLCNDTNNQDTIKAKYAACWQQIATKFKDYDEHLIFESMNEEFDGKTYAAPVNAEYYANINAYNQIFVDTVRQAGGNNDKRWLLMPGWNTNIDLTVGNHGFKLPTDSHLSDKVPSGEKRIMISVHFYDPYEFTHEAQAQGKTQWGSSAPDSSKKVNWGGYIPDEPHVNSQLKLVYDKFSSKGYPVVIGEYGAVDCSGVDSQNLACRKEYYKTVCKYSLQYGCIPVAWDNHGLGTTGTNNFGLFNRKTFQPTANGAEIIASIMSVYYEGGMGEAALQAAREQANSVISEAESKNKADYTAEKWGPFAQALENAKAAVADSQATAEKIKAATTALQTAMSGLTQTQSPAPGGSQPPASDTPSSSAPESSQPPASDVPSSSAPAGSQPPASSVPQSPGPEGSQAPPSSMAPTETPDSDAGNVAGVQIKKVKSPKKATVKVTWKKAPDVNGYEVKLGTDKKVTKSVKSVTIKQANKTSVTVKKCKRKKKYYVKIRAYVIKDGEKIYGKWSKTKKVRVK